MLAAIPVTTPVVATVAVFTLLLLHTPDDVTSVKLVVKPTHITDVPVIPSGV